MFQRRKRDSGSAKSYALCAGPIFARPGPPDLRDLLLLVKGVTSTFFITRVVGGAFCAFGALNDAFGALNGDFGALNGAFCALDGALYFWRFRW